MRDIIKFRFVWFFLHVSMIYERYEKLDTLTSIYCICEVFAVSVLYRLTNGQS